jgi:hypothetical protein
MNCRQLIILLVATVFVNDAMSLVEYAEDSPAPARRAKKRSRRTVKRNAPPSGAKSSAKASSSSSMNFSGMFDFKSQIISEDVNLEDDSAKVSKYNFDLHTRLTNSIKVDLKYQMIASKNERLAATSQSQKGNPEAVVSLDWINFGERGNRTSIDVLMGHRWGVTGSEFASSRNDFILGVQSFKTLGPIALGLGYTVDLTGNPQSASESYIGNVQTLKASLGWMVSSEIRMALHASRINITQSGNEENYNVLENDLEFTVINPELSLTLGPMVDLTLGGYFRSQSEDFQNGYEDIRLPQYNALWGNSIYSGLEFSL